ncbi:uncharacterized protein Z519_12095 [Cladophialophora bantiana CBS 173.52]|uniref:Uncharacterized protein n=1 Tax=Cladophialophora bantiana (strain ATCC 10958 / CBS 173.52 / CDC B-1940 / NIH 8579) TaxID=1442370 RepID=A0A0D2H1N9_CLAB1|nr:uncharacterized protein Z519_12095 [Cladophialophora bantiana CBS 173.52]KIW87193.1 hypothetical protein Z519_12095 [Cladophialophora bantiana CBS 173.52]
MHPEQQSSTDCVLANCETIFDRPVTILCQKEAAFPKYIAVAAGLSEPQPESGRRFSILLSSGACSSASSSVESLLCLSAKLLQRCFTTADGVAYLRTENLDVLDEDGPGHVESNSMASFLDQQLNTNRTPALYGDNRADVGEYRNTQRRILTSPKSISVSRPEHPAI